MNRRCLFSSLPRTERGAAVKLDVTPDGNFLLYPHGHSVVFRDLANPWNSAFESYTQHSVDVTSVRVSPTGFYAASGDKSGRLRIFDLVNKDEFILKAEYMPIAGPIYDLAWSADGQRMVAVGEGREKFGHAFLTETGTSNGDISGQSKPVNSVDIRPTRPFRVITASEDNTAAVYEGPPFKFKTTKNDHKSYCQVVRYDDSGDLWASAGFDGKVFLYDGKTSEIVKELKDFDNNAHKGGIYGLAWGHDNNKNMLLTASGDKTCKIWDVEANKVVNVFQFGSEISDQQLGCAWSPKSDFKISISLSGHINFLDPRQGTKPCLVVVGHNKPITAMTKAFKNDEDDKDKVFIYTADSEGKVVRHNTEDGSANLIECHDDDVLKTKINSIKASKVNNEVYVAAIDDKVRKLSKVNYDTFKKKLEAQPVAMCESSGSEPLLFVATVKFVAVLEPTSLNVLSETPLEFEPSCIEVSSSNVFVGEKGEDGGKCVHIFSQDGSKIVKDGNKMLKLTGEPTAMALSSDNQLLAVADTNRKVTVFKIADGAMERVHTRDWGFHSARVTCVAFSPNCKFVASGGLDCNVIIWSLEHPNKHYIHKNAHMQSAINGIEFLDNRTVVTAGHDSDTKVWNVTWKPE